MTLFPDLPWPLSYEKLSQTFGFASLDVSGISRAACILPSYDYIDDLMFSTLWPIGLLVLMYMAYLCCRCRVKTDNEALKIRWAYAGMLLVYLVFPSNSAKVIRFFNCVELDAYPGTIRVMIADMSISCRSTRYKLTRYFAWAMVLIYPIGIPLFCAALLFWYRKRINPPLFDDDYGLSDSSQNKMRGLKELIRVRTTKQIEKGIDKRDADTGLGWLKFLYEDYEPRCYWFTVVELLRRLWLTALIALLGSDEELTSATQLSLGLLGSIIYYIVLSGYDPYISRSDDFLGKVAAGQIVLTCVEINHCVGCTDNSSLSQFSAMTRPCWLHRAARNRHRHAI